MEGWVGLKRAELSEHTIAKVEFDVECITVVVVLVALYRDIMTDNHYRYHHHHIIIIYFYQAQGP